MALRCVVSEIIHASSEAVFALASDFQGAPERIRGITKMEVLTPGPVGVGTTFRETRVMFGKEATETMEVVEFQPGRSYTLRALNCGCEYRTTVSVKPVAAGHATPDEKSCEISFDFAGTPLTFGSRVMNVLMGWMVKGMCVKAIKSDMADLKSAAETPAPRS